MRVLVLYGSKYGSTAEIAQRIARRLYEAGCEVNIETGTYAGSIDQFDAFVIGSAVYMGSWLKEPADWVRRHARVLATRPVWFFSSGPLGEGNLDELGKDRLKAAVPKEMAEFDAAIKPRGHRVFFGALEHEKFGLAHRMLWNLPAARKLLIEGDFRDWNDVDGWTLGIAEALAPAGVS